MHAAADGRRGLRGEKDKHTKKKLARKTDHSTSEFTVLQSLKSLLHITSGYHNEKPDLAVGNMEPAQPHASAEPPVEILKKGGKGKRGKDKKKKKEKKTKSKSKKKSDETEAPTPSPTAFVPVRSAAIYASLPAATKTAIDESDVDPVVREAAYLGAAASMALIAGELTIESKTDFMCF